MSSLLSEDLLDVCAATASTLNHPEHIRGALVGCTIDAEGCIVLGDVLARAPHGLYAFLALTGAADETALPDGLTRCGVTVLQLMDQRMQAVLSLPALEELEFSESPLVALSDRFTPYLER